LASNALPSPSTWGTSSRPASWPRIQYVPFWNILPRTGRNTPPNTHSILQDKGKVTALEARLKAEAEYEVFRQRQDKDYLSDFDREIKRIEGKKP